MSEKKNTRHFHAGKLRKMVGGIEFVEQTEGGGLDEEDGEEE